MNPRTELKILNRQRLCRIDARLLRDVLRHLLANLLDQPRHTLGFHIVRAHEMASVNQRFLRHAGATDVITFNHSDAALNPSAPADGNLATSQPSMQDPCLHGEVYICIDLAIDQARSFKTSWPSEIVRYATHGTLHLLGYDDQTPVDRIRMKQREDALLGALAGSFRFADLERRGKPLRTGQG